MRDEAPGPHFPVCARGRMTKPSFRVFPFYVRGWHTFRGALFARDAGRGDGGVVHSLCAPAHDEVSHQRRS